MSEPQRPADRRPPDNPPPNPGVLGFLFLVVGFGVLGVIILLASH